MSDYTTMEVVNIISRYTIFISFWYIIFGMAYIFKTDRPEIIYCGLMLLVIGLSWRIFS